MRRAAVMTALCLLLAAPGAQAERIEYRLSADEATSLYALAYGYAGIGVPDEPPHFYPVTSKTLALLACGKPDCGARALQVADAIFYDHRIDTGDPLDLSILVHELVHYAQWVTRGEATTCVERRAREEEAYRVQAEVLDRINLRLAVPALPGCA